MEILTNEITGIIAPKQSGKTFEACQLIRSQERVAVYDILHETQYAFACEEVIFGNPKLFAEAIKQDRFRVAYRTAHIEEGFEHFCKLCYLRGKMTMVVEEADQICSPHYISDMLHPAINLGRHSELSIVYICRSFAGIHRDLTRNTNRFIFFKMMEPRDLEGIRERCGMETANAVYALRKLQVSNGQVVPGDKLIWTDDGNPPAIEGCVK